MASVDPEDLSPVKRALLQVRELKARLEVAERRAAEPIAVVGMALRFPGASDPDSFWRLLHDGAHAVTEIPRDRWDVDDWFDPRPQTPGKMYTRHGGFIDGVDLFDPHLFGISPLEAASMDPQQRILLEVTWAALEDAGVAPDALKESPTGVFVGMAGSDYSRLVLADPARVDVYAASGTAFSVAAGRISYLLGLRGPSLAVDTACSSSLTAVHLAAQSLRSGECRLALAGGVNLILLPAVHVNFCQAGMLAADGRCKTFDAAADGYVRGEGCGIVVLKRLADAVADGDRIAAVIRSSALNQDGRSGGLTAPSGPAQEAVLRAALQGAGLEPADVDYVEAHGTGTWLGDPIEIEALGQVFGQGRPPGRPLRLGSVKTNVGHLEAAAGVAGLIKVVLSLCHEEIPPHLHLRQLNPHVDWSSLAFEVPTAPTPWRRGARRRYAGVSSFGFSGTNAHVILEEAPSSPKPAPSAADRQVHLITLSAGSESALRACAGRLADRLRAEPGLAIADVAHTLASGRARLPHRLALVTGSWGSPADALADVASGAPAPLVIRGRAPSRRPEVAFLFPGQGPQFPGMGRELYETEETFRCALERCDALLRGELEHPLLDVMFAAEGDERAALLDQTVYTQPALFALEYALVELLRAVDVVPSALIGHSLGEYVAACAAGVLSLEDALSLVAERGRLMQSLPRDGAMAAINLPEARALEAIRPRGEALWVAAVNGPESVVVSGKAWAVDETVAELAGRGVRVQRLRIAASSHSPLVEPILDALQRKAGGLVHSNPRVELISNVDGAPVPPGLDWPRYWVRHMRQAVRFGDGMQTLEREGYRVFVEIAPHPTLLSQGQECVTSRDATWIPTLRRGRSDRESLLEGLGMLYVSGVPFDAATLDRGSRRARVALPTYPFERERFWFDGAIPADGEPAWPVLERSLRTQSRQGPLDLRIASFPAKWELLERLTTAYEVGALRELGLFATAGERLTPADAVARAGLKATYVRLVGRWFEKLAAEGVLERDGEVFMSAEPLAGVPVSPLLEEAATLFDDYPEVLAYLRRCGDRLARVLAGRESPLETLFPGGSFVIADGIYRDSCVARYLNGMVRAAFEAAVRSRPAGLLRVLEIGGGTAGSSISVLPVLPPRRTSYLFTDVSDLFLASARERLAEYPFVEYALFDVENDPSAQGVAEGSFDLILAANVLHATRDLRATVARVRSLLAPGGVLVLSETTSHPYYFDVTTGLIEGWQSFADDLRGDNPLVPAKTWLSLLGETGFEHAAAFPEADNPAAILGNHIVVALAPGTPGSASAHAAGPAAPSATRVAEPDGGDAPVPGTDLRELRAAAPAERRALLTQIVRRRVMEIMRLDAKRVPDADRGLIDLGLDSLMAVQLRNRLGEDVGLVDRLPSTLVFEHPTCSAIAAFLDRQLFDAPVASPPPRPTATSGPGHVDVGALSDREAEALLLERLDRLEGRNRDGSI